MIISVSISSLVIALPYTELKSCLFTPLNTTLFPLRSIILSLISIFLKPILSFTTSVIFPFSSIILNLRSYNSGFSALQSLGSFTVKLKFIFSEISVSSVNMFSPLYESSVTNLPFPCNKPSILSSAFLNDSSKMVFTVKSFILVLGSTSTYTLLYMPENLKKSWSSHQLPMFHLNTITAILLSPACTNLVKSKLVAVKLSPA